MNELTTFRWSLEEDLHYYRRAGFSGVGVWRRKLNDFGLDKSVELLADSGLEVTNLMWAGGFTGGDDRVLEEAIADATRAIELAEAINARCLVLHTGGRNLHTHRHASRLVRSALEDLLPVAEARGVTLAVEPMHPACASEWTMLTSLEAASQLIEDYRSEALQMVFDSYQFADASPGEIAAVASKTALVRLADITGQPTMDQERQPLGMGEAPLERMIQALVEGGFEGAFDVQLLGCGATPDGYEELVRESATRAIGLLSGVPDLQPSHG